MDDAAQWTTEHFLYYSFTMNASNLSAQESQENTLMVLPMTLDSNKCTVHKSYRSINVEGK